MVDAKRLLPGDRDVLVAIYTAQPDFGHAVHFHEVYNSPTVVVRPFRNGAALQVWVCAHISQLETKGLVKRPTGTTVATTRNGWDKAAKLFARRNQKEKKSVRRTRSRR
jgi:hypothetical protein